MKNQTCYKTLDKIHAENDQNDRANRGVKLKGFILALCFSAVMWYLVFLAVTSL